MFNVGAGELLVILLIALIVLGPDKLPDAARKIGNVMGELRRMSSGFQSEMRSAMDEVTRPPLETVKPDEPQPETTQSQPDDSAA
jgi:sec-independent protein translocase protein TatB